MIETKIVTDWHARALIVIALSIGMISCAGPGSATVPGIDVGSRAVDFTLESPDGEVISLKDYRGQIVLLNFWATWCAPCRSEIPDLEAAYLAHRDHGFAVVGINVDEPADRVTAFLEERPIAYPILLDPHSEVAAKYRLRGLPMSLLLDRHGVIQVRHMGYLPASQLELYLAQALR